MGITTYHRMMSIISPFLLFRLGLLSAISTHNLQGTLTHLPLVPHLWLSESGQHWLKKWFVAYSAPTHYLNQCWVVVNGTLRNKLQWKSIKIQNFSFTKIPLKIYIVCEMAAILSRGWGWGWGGGCKRNDDCMIILGSMKHQYWTKMNNPFSKFNK